MLYVLSILGSLQMLFIVATLACAAWCVFTAGTIADHARDDARLPHWRRMRLRAAVLGVLCATAAALIPTREELVQSYATLEARKVLTAENAEKAIADFSGKADRLIAAIAGERAECPKPEAK